MGARFFGRAALKRCAAKVDRRRPRSSGCVRVSRRARSRRRASGLPSWNARLASNRLIWIFFGKPCSKSGEHAGRAPSLARHGLRGHPNDDDPVAAGRTHDRAAVCPGKVSRAGYYRNWAASAPRQEETAVRDMVQRVALAEKTYGYRRGPVWVAGGGGGGG